MILKRSAAWSMDVVEKQEGNMRKGPWTFAEDMKLIAYIGVNGAGCWNSVAKATGLKRCGKSCRLRWLNYLQPDLKRGSITPKEQRLIFDLHRQWGNRWSRIARSLPGRTDNEIKNHWRTHIRKMSRELIPSSSWPPAPKSPAKIKVDSCEVHDGNQESSTSQDKHQEFTNKVSDINSLSCIEAETYETSKLQYSPVFSSPSVTASQVNVFSDSEEFLWDYNSIALWNLDDLYAHAMLME